MFKSLALGAEAEAVLGTSSFLTVYVLSSAAGVLATVALDPNTALTAGTDWLPGP